MCYFNLLFGLLILGNRFSYMVFSAIASATIVVDVHIACSSTYLCLNWSDSVDRVSR